MEIHRPKLFHGWRELAKEVGIIVVGVLIALGAQEAVGWLHQRVEVADARQALRLEIAADANGALYNVEEERCFSAVMDSNVAWLNGGPRPPPTPVGGLYSLSESGWEVVKVGAVAHMPLDERLGYSRFYAGVESMGWLIDNERSLFLRMVGDTANPALTPADVRRARNNIAQERILSFAHVGASAGLVQSAKAMGVDPKPRSAAAGQQLAKFCASGGMSPAPAGR
jgi:hypothetical protein